MHLNSISHEHPEVLKEMTIREENATTVNRRVIHIKRMARHHFSNSNSYPCGSGVRKHGVKSCEVTELLRVLQRGTKTTTVPLLS